ncbi:hypothetical protein HZA97_05945 [Candidatus Woesearchaeota archaeon]|nr:hypothetical protein [Candidatus Woesearchaeota archaeon]
MTQNYISTLVEDVGDFVIGANGFIAKVNFTDQYIDNLYEEINSSKQAFSKEGVSEERVKARLTRRYEEVIEQLKGELLIRMLNQTKTNLSDNSGRKLMELIEKYTIQMPVMGGN